jgi:hypothetical protein
LDSSKGPFEHEPQQAYRFLCINNGNNWWITGAGGEVSDYYDDVDVCVDVDPASSTWEAEVKAACTQRCIDLTYSEGEFNCLDENWVEVQTYPDCEGGHLTCKDPTYPSPAIVAPGSATHTFACR